MVARATAAASLVTVAAIVWRSDPYEVREIRVVDSPKTLQSVISGQVQFDKSEWKELISIEDQYIELGPNKLEWSTGGSSGGYLYFWQYSRPWNYVWEFAPCLKSDLKELGVADADCSFYQFDSTERWEVFGGRMRTNSLVVDAGEIVLVRHVENRNVAYAVHLVEQDLKGARIRVKPLAR